MIYTKGRGSVHGLAGIPSILMPTIMQWRGRKITFITCCLIIITGWILTYIARTATTILIAEAFHGLGVNSVIIVSFCIISEIVDPKFRLISMSIYITNETLGLSVVGIIGRYLHWKTVSIIMCVPVFIALTIGCISPESPSWLAYKGEFQKCKDSFVWLRGSDERSQKELTVLLGVKKGNKHSAPNNNMVLRKIWFKIKRRDFYMPCLQTFVCLSLFYNSGTVVVVTYAMDMIRKTTENESAAVYGMISIDAILFAGTFLNVFVLKHFNNKSVLLFSGFGTAMCLFCETAVTYLQHVDVLPRDCLLFLYCLIAFVVTNSVGIATMCFTVAAELMPVKHRDLGGSFYVVLTCLLHFISLKVSPYLFLHLQLWGTLLLYTINTVCCSLYIWKYFPETKNRTLQEIEDYYNDGCFINRFDIDECVELKILDENKLRDNADD